MCTAASMEILEAEQGSRRQLLKFFPQKLVPCFPSSWSLAKTNSARRHCGELLGSWNEHVRALPGTARVCTRTRTHTQYPYPDVALFKMRQPALKRKLQIRP